ncbi:predicted protein [Plenodomus lingam JN3]|uniref:Predicted protein n=1 Tax=Leptosphaeria maculans (strain JN3 / isolate v23.1.3 / race Av1-4-5-6-7-8) TaxID=985895 RepID=E5A4H9_LEPMJ|nr:predicted protein [Plenodomus lingam JN3]CBX98527.1 predicted protein [Plenodomus lingam JN3]
MQKHPHRFNQVICTTSSSGDFNADLQFDPIQWPAHLRRAQKLHRPRRPQRLRCSRSQTHTTGTIPAELKLCRGWD